MSETTAAAEIRRTLSNIRSLRVFARETEFELLLDMHEKLGAVIEERREEAEREAQERAVREKKRLELLQLISEEGWTLEELQDGETAVRKGKKNRTPSTRPPKYRFTDPETGKEETWTGVGRPKKGFQQLLDAGHSADEFLIEKSQEQQLNLTEE